MKEEKQLFQDCHRKYDHLGKEINKFKNNHWFPFGIEHPKNDDVDFKKYQLNTNLIEDEKMNCEKWHSFIFIHYECICFILLLMIHMFEMKLPH